ncbi:signal peptidase II [Marisediminicola antarctica]|uniref:Lipoprotein signal peptidase n=1 Tax=Marisediminicola antarctica TaxID=674079 RepID=A0A7L5AHZ2_9MICO|nr:signal peptidase II [Marisediminicola antarctica]QHO70183.1 signal peptidase II [Marisediminicola antarctica]
MATEPTAAARTAGVSVRAILALVTVALAVFAFDQITKYFVVENLPLGEPVPVLGNVLDFVFVKNPGAAFSLASGATWIFSIAASVVTVLIIVFARRIRSLTWAILFGMLLGGTLGNLTDRLLREPSFGLGHVIDFIRVAGFPAVFNIADTFIVASMGLFIILTIRGVGLDGEREQKPSAAKSGPGASGTESAPADSTPDATER